MEDPEKRKIARMPEAGKKDALAEKILNRVELRIKFRKEVACHLATAEVCQKGYARSREESDISLLADLQKAKKNFFEALDSFRESGYRPSDKINEESLAKLDEYREERWSDGKVIEEVKDAVKRLLE